MATRNDVVTQYGILETRLNSVDPFIKFKTKARLRYVFANIDTWLSTDIWNPTETEVADECINNIDIINGYLDFVAIVIAGGGGGGDTYTNLTPTPTTIGGISTGTTFAARTMQQMWDHLLYPELFPTLTNPSSTFVSSVSGFREIGENIATLTFTASFNRGSISPAYGTSGFRSGLPNTYTYTGSTLPASVSSTALSNVQTISGYVVTSGSQSWTNVVSYSIGEQPLSSSGNNYNSPLPAGNASLKTATITGVYPIFATTVNITTMTKQTLVANGSVVSTSLVMDSGGDKQKVEFPNTWGAITLVEQWNPLLTQWDVVPLSTFTITAVTETIQGNVINYNRYTYNDVTIGERILRWTV